MRPEDIKIRTEEDEEPSENKPDMMAELRAIRKATQRGAKWWHRSSSSLPWVPPYWSPRLLLRWIKSG